MNNTSTLQGILLDAYGIFTLPIRRFFTALCDKEGACRVPTGGLCPWFNEVPELVEGPSRSLASRSPLIN